MELTAYANPALQERTDVFAKLLRRSYVKAEPVRLPKVTIITVTFNSAYTISSTLESIRRQTYPNIEHIVVDGNSTDDTLDIVNRYPHVARCISERDNGIYDAMNKGLQLATGDIIGILNSDDVYNDDEVIEKVVGLFRKEKTDSVYGDLQYVDPANMTRVLRQWISGKFKRTKFKFGWMPPHPTFFVKKEVYQEAGLFNQALRSAADYELMLRVLYKFRFTTAYLPEVLVKMRAGGSSNGALRKRLVANREDRLAWKLNQLKPYFFTLYLKPVRKIFQYMNREQMKRVPLLNSFL